MEKEIVKVMGERIVKQNDHHQYLLEKKLTKRRINKSLSK